MGASRVQSLGLIDDIERLNGDGPDTPPLPTVPSNGAEGNGGTSSSVAASGDQRIDGLLTGVKWSNSTITYTDPAAASDYQSGYFVDRNSNGVSAQNEGFGRISPGQLLAVQFALDDATFSEPAGSSGFAVEAFTNLGINASRICRRPCRRRLR